VTKRASGNVGEHTFTTILVVLLVHEVIAEGVLVHEAPKEALHVICNVQLPVSNGLMSLNIRSRVKME
jgi:hypothetical protein